MINKIDEQGVGFWEWFLTSLILACVIATVIFLGGCASMPSQVPQPMMTAQGTNPNCVFWCHVVITTAKAESDIKSDGTAPITSGDQTIDLDSTMSTSKEIGVEPRP